MISLSIDGKKATVEDGTTVLEAARSVGVDIPTLCYHPELKPNSACRLCTVEVTQRGRTRLTASCSLPAEEGMEVQTATERVLAGRRILMELLAARCSENDPIREIAAEMGARTDRLEPWKDDCILCGLCVAVCDEVLGVRAISFSGRGVDRQVDKPFKAPAVECLACGACSFLCPTGAIQMEHETISRDKEEHAERECRYMRMGMIPYGLCPSALQCYRCEVDQRMVDTLGTHPAFVARPARQTAPVDVSGYAVLPNRYYHAGHAWVESIGGHLRVGLDDFARTLLGSVESVELLKETGTEVKAGDELYRLCLAGGRHVTMTSPVSGTIAAANEDVVLDPTLLGKAPYSRGWICMIRPSAKDEELASLRFKDPKVPHYRRAEPDPVNDWVSGEAEKLAGMLAERGPEVFADGQVRANLSEVLSDADWQTMTQAFFGGQQ